MTTSPTEGRGGESADHAGGRVRVPGRAMIYGTGLIGGSVGLALRARGWWVSGIDAADGVATRALELGALSEVGIDHRADLVVVATPVHVAGEIIAGILADPDRNRRAVITDVGGVKAPLVAAIDHPYFVGGHPMAGSEQVGLDGATAELFVGATWVLTPTAVTDPAAYTQVHNLLVDLGANVVALDPSQHDALVAVVSHVPHLTAATLMDLAAGLGQEHAALLQLAAGGFRDMTRIAAGHPAIWLDICDENADAIVETLDLLIDALGAMRRRVAEHDHRSLLEILDRASTARRALGERTPLPRGAGRGPHSRARPDRDDRRDHRARHRARHQHRRPRDRPLGGRQPGGHAGGGRPAVGPDPPGHALGPGLPRHQHTGGSDPVSGPTATGTNPPDGAAHTVSVRGGVPLSGTLAVPGDKSISHRALLLAALAEGTSTITGLCPGDDVVRTRGAIVALGAEVEDDGPVVVVHGGRSRLAAPSDEIDLGNSGTGMRLLAGVAATLDGTTTLVGDASLQNRPMDRVAEPLGRMGARVTGRGQQCLPPLSVTGGALRGIEYTPPVASAQVKSALLLAGLDADGETVVSEPVATRAYTEEMLAAAGADVSIRSDGIGRVVRIRRSALRSGSYTVPGDPSQAAFWLVGSVIVPGSLVTVTGIDLSAERLGFIGVLRRMGATVEVEEAGNGTGSLTGYTALLHGTVVEAAEIPSLDEVPVLAVAATAATGRHPVPRHRRIAGQGVGPPGRDRRAGPGLRGWRRGRGG